MNAKSDPLQLTCPHCGRDYRNSARLAGKRVNCTCGQQIDVPPLPGGITIVSRPNPPRSLLRRLRDDLSDPGTMARMACWIGILNLIALLLIAGLWEMRLHRLVEGLSQLGR